MTTIAPVAGHGVEFLRMLNAKDDVGLLALLADDAQIVDELTRHWVRGRSAIGTALRAAFSRVSDVHSEAIDLHVERWADVEVETFVLHQTYDLDGVTTRVVAPTTLLWRRTPAGWRLALVHSIPTSGG